MAKSTFQRLFDTHDPDNNLGPLVVAVIIAIATAIITGAIGLSHPHP
jgi:hypothetical protein